MSRLRKKLSILLSIIMVILSLPGLNVFAGENGISVYGTNGNATQIEKGTSMKMAVSGVSQGKSVTWSVTDLDGSATSLAEITQIGALTAILTASDSNYGTFKVVATQNDASGKKGEQIIRIANENLITVDDNDASIIYERAGSGEDWETNNSGIYYQGTGKSVTPPEDDSYSSSVPAYAEFSFTGTGIQWIGESNSRCGIAEVYLDGTRVATVDPFIAPGSVKQCINFSREGLPYGEHTIKVVATGQKNPANTLYPGTKVLIDAFRYLPGQSVPEVDKTKLQETITAAQTLTETAYTPESWTVLLSALNTALAINSKPDASQSEVDTALSNLVDAMAGLVSIGPAVVLTGADRVLPEEPFSVGISLYHVSQDVYAESITMNFNANVFEYVRTEGENSNVQIVTEEADASGSVRIIAANIGGVTGERTPLLKLTFKGKSGVQNTSGIIAVTKAELGIAPEGTVITAGLSSKTITIGSTETVDKTVLADAVNSAEALYTGAVVGNMPGQYPQTAKDEFRTAIDAAALVLNDSNTDQEAVNSAVTALNTAVEIFKAAVVKETRSPDLNTDGKIDVVDLAIVAYYYGKDSSSEEWELAKAADINLDGKIDISDLAYLALKIID